MKVVKYLILGIVMTYIQLIIAGKLKLLGIIPNFFLAYIVFQASKLEFMPSMILTFIFGIAFDLTYPELLGLNAFSFLVIAFIVNRFHSNINKDRWIIILLSMMALNTIYFVSFLLYYFLTNISIESIFLTSLWAIFYNSFWTFIIVYTMAFCSRINLYVDA